MPAPVRAVQDLDCLDRVKFTYELPSPIPPRFLDLFADARVVIHKFSALAPLARDLFTITLPGRFRADGIVGGTAIIVSFDGDPVRWPLSLIDDFARRLHTGGFPSIDYVRGAPIDCGACPARFTKNCRGNR